MLMPKMQNVIIINTILGTTFVINPLLNISINNRIKLKIANSRNI